MTNGQGEQDETPHDPLFPKQMHTIASPDQLAYNTMISYLKEKKKK